MRMRTPPPSNAVAAVAMPNGSTLNGSTTSMSADADADDKRAKSSGRSGSSSSSRRSSSSVLFVLRTVVLDLPLLLVVLLWASTLLVHHLYNGPMQELIESFRRDGSSDELGYFPELDSDITYYGRQCTEEDITTRDSNDLMIPPEASAEEAADIMMTHGAVLVQDILNTSTATALREYLESRHAIQDELPWHEKMWAEIGRLSLGLGVGDAPIIAQALQEVATHPTLQRTLQGIVGDDPAIVEISTLTTMHGAQEQGTIYNIYIYMYS
jgi:hypothetical protein